MTDTKSLSDQSRDELNALATSLGIDAPEKLANKAEVIATIEAVQAGQNPPPADPEVRSQLEELGHPFAAAYRYVGPGVVPGVPDHDLTPFDVANVPADVMRDVHFCGFYEPVKDGE
ncbi:MAG: hypothetical protein ACTHMX_09870 [Thermomicrobiales bacterium]